MRFIVDTNVVFSALIKDSATRKLIHLPGMEYYTPEFAHIEIENHKEEIRKKSRMDEGEFDILLDSILSQIIVSPIEEYKAEIKEAYQIMKDIDPDDTPFLALAINLNCDGIWSNDSDFEKQNRIKVWKTKDMVRFLPKKPNQEL